jgi:hypothetical protein
MLFLVSGASGVGKSTVREIVAPRLGDAFEAVELGHLGSLENITIARRQELAEAAADRASVLARSGRHLLLSGDPVAPGELVAAPSATKVGGLAICILDANAEAQTARLQQRGDPKEYLPLHLGYAQWMREHAIAPTDRLDVLKLPGWERMQWERLGLIGMNDPRWRVRLIDTSHRSRDAVAEDVIAWIKAALEDDSLVMRPENWS